MHAYEHRLVLPDVSSDKHHILEPYSPVLTSIDLTRGPWTILILISWSNWSIRHMIRVTSCDIIATDMDPLNLTKKRSLLSEHDTAGITFIVLKVLIE